MATNVATGQVNHRRVCGCGNRFSVKDGVVKEKGSVYRCPFCNGSVRSDVKTGRIDHRSACGNQFHVKDGQSARKHSVMRTVARSAQLLFGHRSPLGALRSHIRRRRENDARRNIGTFPRKREGKKEKK